MSKVFIAHKSVDRDRAAQVQKSLEALGVPVFIDITIRPDENYLVAINRELAAAVAVLVLWSKEAAHLPADDEPPNFVLAEAEIGYYRKVFVAATLEKIERLPAPFNLQQTSDLSDWMPTAASAKHLEWQKVLTALGEKLKRPGLPNLAIALESDDVELKRAFLRDYPADPLASRLAAQLEGIARKDFAEQIAKAQKRIQQRAKQAQAKLRSCREKFEAQIADIRAGQDVMPPDPVGSIDDNVAMLSDQVEIYEGELKAQRAQNEQAEASAAKATAEITVLGEKVEQLQKQIQASQSSLEEQRARAERAELGAVGVAARDTAKLTQHLKDQRRRVIAWCGSAALAAAVLAGLAGRWTAPGPTVQPSVSDAAIQAQLANLVTENAGLRAANRDLAAKERDLTAQLNDAQRDAKAREAELAKDQPALASISAADQCNLLAGYQYDADRPQSGGWADSVGNTAEAQAICNRARQSVGGDSRVERRTVLALGRIYLAARATDTALQLWMQAAAMGSSHAAFELGRYYADRNSAHFDSNKAWGYYKQAADMVPPDPVALYWVAYNNLFPDDRDTSIIPPAQADPGTGQEYLQKALNTDFPTAYFIAGVYYWHKSKTERRREDQNTDIENATNYLTIAWCIKHSPRAPEKTADQFYFGQTGKHLTCQ